MELTLADIRVRLGTIQALDGVSIRFASGRVTAILGPNGAGKSTLASVAAGLRAADTGSATLGDRPLGALPVRERARLIGYLPQSAALHWNIAARELVALGRLPHRGPFGGMAAADWVAVDRAMEATDTTVFAARPTAELSGGERARVLLARVLAGEPRWIIADEPLAGLDPAHQLDVLARLRDAARAGVGVVLVLHDLSHAARAADDALLLAGGRAVASGPVADVMTPARLREVYGIDVFVGTDGAGGPVLVPFARTR